MILLFHNFLHFAKLLNKKYGTHTESRILHLHKIFYSASERLQGIILRASEQIGKQVVVLIDEYDAPLLDSNSDTALQQQLRNEMRKFFSPPQEVGAVSSLSLHHRHQQVQPTEHLQRTE